MPLVNTTHKVLLILYLVVSEQGSHELVGTDSGAMYVKRHTNSVIELEIGSFVLLRMYCRREGGGRTGFPPAGISQKNTDMLEWMELHSHCGSCEGTCNTSYGLGWNLWKWHQDYVRNNSEKNDCAYCTVGLELGLLPTDTDKWSSQPILHYSWRWWTA